MDLNERMTKAEEATALYADDAEPTVADLRAYEIDVRRVLNAKNEALEQAEATIARVEAALADALDCQNTADPSERMRCAMCCNDHFADVAAALAQPDQEGTT